MEIDDHTSADSKFFATFATNGAIGRDDGRGSWLYYYRNTRTLLGRRSYMKLLL